MESIETYLARRHIQLEDKYNTVCYKEAKEIAKRLFLEGKKSHIVKMIDPDYLEPKKYEGKVSWVDHFVCFSSGKAYDPIIGFPITVKDYYMEAFGKNPEISYTYESFEGTFQHGEEIYLDLNLVDLFCDSRDGWKSDLCIDSIIKGIESGDEFPAVPIVKLKDRMYSLTLDAYVLYYSYGKGERATDGGHNRAIVHFIANKPLRCKLGDWRPLPVNRRKHVKDMLIEEEYDNELQKRRIRKGFYR